MAMRIDVDFPRPLTKAEKLRVLLAVATLAKAQRVRFIRGDYAAVVSGEGVSARRMTEVLAEAGVTIETLRTSLDPDEDLHADDLPGDPTLRSERVRAIGR